MLLELALVEEGFVRIPVDLFDVRVFDGGHAFAVQQLLNVKNPLSHLFGGGDWDEAGDRLHGRHFLEDAGGVAVGVAVNRTGAWIGCGNSDVRKLERERVGNSVMAGGVGEPDGVVRGNGVEIGGRDVAVFGELALVPSRARDPFSGLNKSDFGLYSGDDFSYRTGIR